MTKRSALISPWCARIYFARKPLRRRTRRRSSKPMEIFLLLLLETRMLETEQVGRAKEGHMRTFRRGRRDVRRRGSPSATFWIAPLAIIVCRGMPGEFVSMDSIILSCFLLLQWSTLFSYQLPFTLPQLNYNKPSDGGRMSFVTSGTRENSTAPT